MMKKKFMIAALAGALSMVMSMPAFAMGEWQKNDTGWWWQHTDGRYPTNCWKWIDGNADGTVECYYFDGNGYMLTNTTTPDNFTVNENGAWTVNGAVQQRGFLADLGDEAKANAASPAPNAVNGSSPVMDGYSVEKIVLNEDLTGAIRANGLDLFPSRTVVGQDYFGPVYDVDYKGHTLRIETSSGSNYVGSFLGEVGVLMHNIPAQGIEMNAFYDNVGYESKSSGRNPMATTGRSDALFGLPTASYRMAWIDIGNRHLEILLTSGADGKYYIYPTSKAFMR